MIKFLRSTLGRLTLSYLIIIMFMSLAFSLVIYRISANELRHEGPPRSFYVNRLVPPDDFESYFNDRAKEARNHLVARLILLNVLVFLGGAALSYYLAKRTLEPIEEAVESQARFASDASHELRTPLTAIRTTNEVALRKTKLSAAEARQIIKNNLEEIMKLESLSEGLLRLSRGGAVALERKKLWLNDVAAEAMNQKIAAAQAKQIAFKDSVPKLAVMGDASGLSQVLNIMIDNAIKYSPSGTMVKLTGGTRGDRVFINISDEGYGIKGPNLPRIFERFYRADQSRSRDLAPGYGLGLAIAEQIVSQHKGEITVESSPGRGSTFTVWLPAAKA